ncbi:hypothetical protein C492_07090 [Natronococcus jeotgali DSM 18795]|uniref:Uncharacterized protein n=1 Tax=Natronococcus jeotgali DSM 18795 TaxID=1227498 RepID=L9XPM6_9EURY|nr:hypothetical protein C492_07090 [Natronococcus jeotgali DSM 18795]
MIHGENFLDFIVGQVHIEDIEGMFECEPVSIYCWPINVDFVSNHRIFTRAKLPYSSKCCGLRSIGFKRLSRRLNIYKGTVRINDHRFNPGWIYLHIGAGIPSL